MASEPIAASLPANTVVLVKPGKGPYSSTRHVAYIRNHPGPEQQWRGTDGSYTHDAAIDEMFARGRGTVMSPVPA